MDNAGGGGAGASEALRGDMEAALAPSSGIECGVVGCGVSCLTEAGGAAAVACCWAEKGSNSLEFSPPLAMDMFSKNAETGASAAGATASAVAVTLPAAVSLPSSPPSSSSSSSYSSSGRAKESKRRLTESRMFCSSARICFVSSGSKGRGKPLMKSVNLGGNREIYGITKYPREKVRGSECARWSIV